MHITLLEPAVTEGAFRYSGEVFINDENQYHIYFDIPTEICSGINRRAQEDAFFLMGSIISSVLCVSFAYPYTVSPALLKNAETIACVLKMHKSPIKSIYHSVKLAVQRALPHARTTSTDVPSNKRGQFFTLGLDSFYTLLCAPKKAEYLVYVDGFDVPLKQIDLLLKIHSTIENVSKKTGTKTLFMSTNVRELSDKILGWESFDGAAFAMCSYFVGYRMNEIYNNNNWGYNNNTTKYCGIGTHIDPYFSTEYIKFLSCGHDKLRYEKAVEMSASPYFDLVLNYARPCYRNDQKGLADFNCCKCAKCTTSYLSLVAASGELIIPAFPDFNIQRLHTIIPVKAPGVKESLEATYKHLYKRFGPDAEIVKETGKYVEKLKI